MFGRIPSIDRDRALLAAKNCAALVVGYGFALGMDWKASWVATTIFVLQTDALGATLHKSTLRMAGTLGGAVVGVAFVSLFAHDRDMFVLAMGMLTGVCVWAMQSGSNVYAWMLVVLTASVVGWPSALDPLHTFQTTVDRVTAVTTGVILSAIANGVFWPVTAADRFEKGLLGVATGCRQMIQAARAFACGNGGNRRELKELISKIMTNAASLQDQLLVARSDSLRLKKHQESYRALAASLGEMQLASAAVCDASLNRPSDTGATGVTPRAVELAFDHALSVCDATIRHFSLPRDGSATGSDPTTTTADPPDDTADAAGGLSEEPTGAGLLLQRLHHFERVAAEVGNRVARAETPGIASGAETTVAKQAPAPFQRLRKSALAALQVVLAAWFAIWMDWPLGLEASMTPVMILVFMNAQLPVALLKRPIARALLVALPIGAIFYFVMMPRIDGFHALAPLIFAFYVPFMYGMTSQNPNQSLAALLGVILLNSLAGISTSPPTYSFVAFANLFLGIGGGFGVVLLLAYLFETRTPTAALRRLVAATLQEGATRLQTLDRAKTADEVIASPRGYHTSVLKRLEKMKKLSAAAEFGSARGCERQAWNEVADRMGALLTRLSFAEVSESSHGGAGAIQDARPASADVMATRRWCIDALEAYSHAVQSGERVATQHAIDTPAEREARRSSEQSQTEYYRTLIDAILSLEDALRAIDWKRWSQPAF